MLLLLAAVFLSYVDGTNISVGAIAMQAQFGLDRDPKRAGTVLLFIGYLLLMLVSRHSPTGLAAKSCSASRCSGGRCLPR